jgi:hypothetical protein
MAAVTYNFTLNQGDDFDFTITIKANNEPIDLSNYSFAGQIREKYDSNEIVASFVCTKANQTTSKGVITFSLTNQQTSAIPCLPSSKANRRPVSEFIYDIEQTDADDKISRILEGVVLVSPGVTR